MIAGLSASGALQSLYPQYNKKKISKIKKVHSGTSSMEQVSSSSEQSDAETIDDAVAANYQATLSEETKDLEMISYAAKNPYTNAKKSIDESLLLGMNVDERA